MRSKSIVAISVGVLLLSGCAVPQTTPPQTETTTTAATTTAFTEATTTAATTTAKTTGKPTVKTTAKPTKATTTVPTKSAETVAWETFRGDNYAVGRFSDELLESVNDGVLALLGECMYFEDKLQEGIEQGQKWVYSNSSKYVPQGCSFDEMVASGKYGGNCAMPQAWAFMDLGVLTGSKHIYGNKDGGIANLGTLGKYIGAVATITAWGGEVRFRDLYTRDKVLPGDIFLAKGHTFIYMGDELFMAAGHDGLWHSDSTAPTEDSNHAVFDSWVRLMENCSDYTYKVTYQIRFKDDYTPRRYRDATGKLVDNPYYDPAYSIEYLKGYSEETPEILIGAL